MHTFAQYNRLGVYVLATDREVIKACAKRIKKSARRSREYREARHFYYREMLKHHAKARNIVNWFRL